MVYPGSGRKKARVITSARRPGRDRWNTLFMLPWRNKQTVETGSESKTNCQTGNIVGGRKTRRKTRLIFSEKFSTVQLATSHHTYYKWETQQQTRCITEKTPQNLKPLPFPFLPSESISHSWGWWQHITLKHTSREILSFLEKAQHFCLTNEHTWGQVAARCSSSQTQPDRLNHRNVIR